MPLQDQLQALFLLDKQVRGLRSRLDAATRRQSLQQNKLHQLTQQAAELADQHKQTQTKANALEHQAQDVDQRIAQHREQMNNVHSNKEYAALLVEVSTLKDQKSRLEDQALEQISAVDALAARQTEVSEKLAQQQKLVEQAGGDVREASAEVGEKLDQASKERNAAAADVPEEARSLFERLADEYDGEALAEVEEQDRRRMEYNCGGCYIALPVEHVNSLMIKPNELVTCPNCQRILYLDQQLKAALKPQQ